MADWFDQNKNTGSNDSGVPVTTINANSDWFSKNTPQVAPVLQNPAAKTFQTPPINPVLQFLKENAPSIMSALGEGGAALATDGASLVPSILGAAGGSLAGQAIKGGEDATDALGQTATDVIGNSLVPRAVTGVAKTIISKTPVVNLLSSPLLRRTEPVQSAIAKDTIEGAQSGLNNLLTNNTDTLTEAAKGAKELSSDISNRIIQEQKGLPKSNPTNINDVPITEPRQLTVPAQSEYNKYFKDNEVAKDLLELNQQVVTGRAGSQEFSDISDKVLSDVQHVRNLKMMNGGVDAANQLSANKVIGSGYSPTANTVDPVKILKALDDPIHKEALTVETRGNIESLANTIKDVQEGQNATDHAMIRYAKHRLMFDAAAFAPAALLGHAAGESTIGLGVGVGSVILANNQLSRLMANPVTAKAVVAAVKNGPNTPVGRLASGIIRTAMQGAYVKWQSPDGSTEDVQVGPSGLQTVQK